MLQPPAAEAVFRRGVRGASRASPLFHTTLLLCPPTLFRCQELWKIIEIVILLPPPDRKATFPGMRGGCPLRRFSLEPGVFHVAIISQMACLERHATRRCLLAFAVRPRGGRGVYRSKKSMQKRQNIIWRQLPVSWRGANQTACSLLEREKKKYK